MLKFIVGILAAVGLSVLMLVVGKKIGYDLSYLSGWWSCLLFLAIIGVKFKSK